MSMPKRKGPGALKSRRRQAVTMSPEQLIKTEPLDDLAMPLVVRPAADGVDLVSWAEGHQEEIERLLMEHGALLFRGFGVQSADDFETFAKITSDGGLLEYRDRSTPRQTRGENVYTSTVYPADQRINLHNEGTYWRVWPLKIYFCCVTAPEAGGQTPIANVGKVLGRINPALRDRFREKKIMYVRNYNDGFGLPWQEVFQTDSRDEVEVYCRTNDIEFEWKGGDRLRTRQIRPAVRTHPKTGEEVWFNHGAFFHVTALDPQVRASLLENFAVEDLPYNTYYGDGSPIDPDDVAALFDAYDAETVAFSWQEGDVMMLNNMAVAHGRAPYRGDREVLAAMTEPYGGAA